jgi:hypothetical protein
MTLPIEECALPSVAREHLAPNGRGDATFLGRAYRRAPRTVRLREPLLLELVEECVQRLLHHDGKVAAWIAVPHQVPSAFELRAELSADRELNLVTRF